MKYLCPGCDQLMTDSQWKEIISNNKICQICELIYDYEDHALFTFDHWDFGDDPIIEGDFEYCRRVYKMKAFI